MPLPDSRLVSRNITINGHRTSIRLEGQMWDAYDEVCLREGLSSHGLCALIDQGRNGTSRTAAVRAFIVNYFRSAATEDGHRRAGHGRVGDISTTRDNIAANA